MIWGTLISGNLHIYTSPSVSKYSDFLYCKYGIPRISHLSPFHILSWRIRSCHLMPIQQSDGPLAFRALPSAGKPILYIHVSIP